MNLEIRILLFGIVGLLGMVTDFTLTWLMRDILRLNQYIANGVGFCAAVVQNYLLNLCWTFQDRQAIHGARQWSTFFAVSICGLALNTFVLKWLNGHHKGSFYWHKVIAIGVVFIWNFTVNNLLTFAE